MATSKSVEAEQEAAPQETAVPEVNNADFTEAQEIDVTPGEENLDLLLDVQMPLTVIMGKTIMSFKRLLQLGPGSVIQLDKTVGQPADLYIQDIRFATADVVVVDDCFAVRIKEILGVDHGELKTHSQA
ncbi:MAG TPA: FliM/FliN family flagellar motor switch protein [Anaerohalosphaeraceae bacterium]|jgi:flagellar motor switch protein FliN/FliY|nr:FliM/FliN family flagellar motor switch protein [Anaerohalosphaeraceae bacterium]HRT49963.1 FliM/FliN family flagellar motor switch protein [Anaerohalosphaeraceae bacterium]HRT85739.1 FliM/FliN family flagellar motor switch protein [Anaerohalosphaeraceae bacterium]